jgi:hypothetical protein
MNRLLSYVVILLGFTVTFSAVSAEEAKAESKTLNKAQIAGVEARAKAGVDAAAKEIELGEEQKALLQDSLLAKYMTNSSKISLDTSDDERRAIWKESNEVFAETLSAKFSKQEIRQIRKAIQKVNEANRIFNGKDLEGWEQVNGTATYEVIDGAIVGTTATGSPNSFLATKKRYENFELQFEVFLVNDELNSGVQFRSNQHTEETLQLYKKKQPVGRVFGYQCEIEAAAEGDLDAKKYGDAGYIYDEARRGWLVDDEARLSAKTRGAFRNQKWNRIKISANGDHIQTWINGKKICDLKDDMTTSGFIALQVHGIGKKEDKWQVKWRNINLKELP